MKVFDLCVLPHYFLGLLIYTTYTLLQDFIFLLTFLFDLLLPKVDNIATERPILGTNWRMKKNSLP